MKIVILGAGSVGCYLGGLLLAAGQEVRFIGRKSAQTRHQSHGLSLTHFSRPAIKIDAELIDFQTQPEALAGADVVALCTKSQDSAAAAAQIKAHCRADIGVISFQNGISNGPILKSALERAQILSAIVSFNITPIDEAGYHCGTQGDLVIEAGVQAELGDIIAAFQSSGQSVRLSDNIIGDQWAKMIVNLNNGLNTLWGGPLRSGLAQRDYRRAFTQLIIEAMHIAKGHDITLGLFNGRSPEKLLRVMSMPDFAYSWLMRFILKIDAQARSSMLDDLEAGRACEIDYLQGEIIRQADLIGQRAPANQAILDAVKTAFEARQSPQLSGRQILDLLKV